MRLWHRHEWVFDARHRSGRTLWTIEACRCGARRKGHWPMVPCDAPKVVLHTYPTVWSRL